MAKHWRRGHWRGGKWVRGGWVGGSNPAPGCSLLVAAATVLTAAVTAGRRAGRR